MITARRRRIQLFNSYWIRLICYDTFRRATNRAHDVFPSTTRPDSMKTSTEVRGHRRRYALRASLYRGNVITHYKISSFGANIFQIPSSFVIRLDRRGLFRNTFDHRRGWVHLSVSVKRKRQCEYYHMKKSNYELWVPFIICNQFRVLDCRPIANDTKLIEVCLRHVICDGKISNQ